MIYVVFVKDAQRWIDSVWFNESNAQERSNAIRMKAKAAFGVDIAA